MSFCKSSGRLDFVAVPVTIPSVFLGNWALFVGYNSHRCCSNMRTLQFQHGRSIRSIRFILLGDVDDANQY